MLASHLDEWVSLQLRAVAAGFLQTQAELLTLNVLIETFDKLSSPSHFS